MVLKWEHFCPHRWYSGLKTAELRLLRAHVCVFSTVHTTSTHKPRTEHWPTSTRAICVCIIYSFLYGPLWWVWPGGDQATVMKLLVGRNSPLTLTCFQMSVSKSFLSVCVSSVWTRRCYTNSPPLTCPQWMQGDLAFYSWVNICLNKSAPCRCSKTTLEFYPPNGGSV